MAEGNIRGFVVTTVCKTKDEFVERYYSRVEGRSLFVSVTEARVIGSECAFAILLADREIVLAGLCEIIELYINPNNYYRRSGMRLGINRLGRESEAVWQELTARARAGERLARGSSGSPFVDEDTGPSAVVSLESALPFDLSEPDEEPTVTFRRSDLRRT